jgi:NAD(P)-dependent dehydrogenase (short-subunit alcohol dehydrogenase family)
MALIGKTIVITGSTDGVGRRVAERLAREGANLILHGRNRARGEALVEEIRKDGKGSATLILADFGSLADVRRFAAEVLKAAPKIDVLINNAGVASCRTHGRPRRTATSCASRSII